MISAAGPSCRPWRPMPFCASSPSCSLRWERLPWCCSFISFPPCALLVVAYWLAVIFFPTLPSNAGGPATFLVPFFLLTAVVVQVYRYRRVSTPRERQPTNGAVSGFPLAMLMLMLG